MVKNTPSMYIVAIGGSAGSMDALKEMLTYTPLDHASYVVIRHLPENYQSQLKLILEKHCKLEIVNVEHDQVMESNKLYIGPSNKDIIIKDGKLILIDREETKPHYPIDLFFKSLAGTTEVKKAIVIVLSGVGSDGARGAEYVKRAGGAVIAQTPASCEYASMPEQVIKSGQADYIATPSEIPGVILNYIRKR